TRKSTQTPARGVVIRETPEMPLSKKKEKVDVTRGKGIELLPQVALTEDAQFEEVHEKSMRDFHKTHPSGSDNENESDSEHETDKSESVLESDHDESKENEEEDDDEDEKRLPIKLKEGTDAVMTNLQQRNDNQQILKVIEYAHVTLSTVPYKTKGLVTRSSHSSNYAAKFLKFLDIPHSDAEIVSPIDVHSMRDFHKTHPSGSGAITKTTPSVSKIKPSATSDGTCIKPGVPNVAKEESLESEAESWRNNEDYNNNK
nr:hypothetical protein [Tanacetum cinerariifolium]